ncbi:MAG: glycosyltransferase [Chloroflexota bacterium]
MASFWFVSAPLSGHLDWGGMLKTAQTLRDTGHSVLWISQPAIAPALAGIEFAAIAETGWLWPPPPMPDPKLLKPAEGMFIRYRRALDTWLSEDIIPPAVEAIVALAESRGKPFAIVTDPFLSAAAFAAEALSVPLIVAGWPAGQPLDEEHMYAVQSDLSRISHERIANLKQRLGLRAINFSGGAAPSVQSPYLHVSYFSREWYQSDPDFLPQTRFVGGMPTAPTTPPPDWLSAIPLDTPLAFITLGSTFTGDLGFFSWAAQACHRLGLLPIIALGRNPIEPEEKAKLKAALPPGTRLLNWIDYDHLFPRLKVIVHHGGMGTTHQALIQGVPQVCVPHAADQRGQAKRVAQAKVGLNLSAHDVRNGQLLPAIRAVTRDTAVITNAAQWATDFANLGGSAYAATLMLQVVEGQTAPEHEQ